MDRKIKIEKGDYARIARIFNARKKGTSVSKSYVRMIWAGEVAVTSEKSREVFQLAEKFFNSKEAVEEELVSAC